MMPGHRERRYEETSGSREMDIMQVTPVADYNLGNGENRRWMKEEHLR